MLIGVAVAVLVMILIKFWIVSADAVPFNADEAVVALMARHILNGNWPVFFYGQAYMGSLDATLVAAGFAIFGQKVWVIRAVQTLLYAGVIVTTAYLALQISKSQAAAVGSAWLMAVPTVNVTLYTTASLGGYGEALLIGNLILILTLSIDDRLDRKDKLPAYLFMLWGGLNGLGLWAFGLSLVYTIPACIYLVWRYLTSQRERRDKWKGIRWIFYSASGMFVGAAPWLLYAIRNGVGSLLTELGGEAIAGVRAVPALLQPFVNLFNLLLLGLTVIFGMRPPWSVDWLALPFLPLALAIWLAVLGFIIRRVWGSKPRQPGELLIAGVMGILALVFLLTPFGNDPSGRYFLPLAPMLAIFAPLMVLEAAVIRGRWVWWLIVFLLVYQFMGTYQVARRNPPGITTQFDATTRVDHRDMEQLIAFLEEKELTRGYTNYWVSYPLAFLSQERLVYIPRLPYHPDFRYSERDDRYAPYTELVGEASQVAYITTNHPELDIYLRNNFNNLGVHWQEERIGEYQVFFELSQMVRPEDIGLGNTTP